VCEVYCILIPGLNFHLVCCFITYFILTGFYEIKLIYIRKAEEICYNLNFVTHISIFSQSNPRKQTIYDFSGLNMLQVQLGIIEVG
jgi:hypothetical protein